jgi:hypothetical protein
MKILRTALHKKPNDERLCDMLIRLEVKYDPEQAIKTAEAGEKYTPTSWRIQRHLARIKRNNKYSLEAIKGHYDAAIRHHRGDIDLLIELGSYLFMNGKLGEANSVFNESKTLEASGVEKYKIRISWTDENNKKILFSGKVNNISGHLGYIMAIPENFQTCFTRTYRDLSKLKQNDSVKFHVGFNAYGSIARLIEY